MAVGNGAQKSSEILQTNAHMRANVAVTRALQGVWRQTYVRLHRIVSESETEAADILMERAIEMGSERDL